MLSTSSSIAPAELALCAERDQRLADALGADPSVRCVDGSTAEKRAMGVGNMATVALLHAHAHKIEYVRSGVVGLLFRGNVPLKAPASPWEWRCLPCLLSPPSQVC